MTTFFPTSARNGDDTPSLKQCERAIYRMNKKGANAQTRPFVAIDSEGADTGEVYAKQIDGHKGGLGSSVRIRHHRTFLWGACSATSAPQWYQPSHEADDIARWLLTLPRRFPRAIFVTFASGYDWTQLFAGLPFEVASEIHALSTSRSPIKAVRYNGICYTYLKGKRLSLSCGKDHITIYDVFGFFQMSFLKAMEQLPDCWTQQEIEVVCTGKASRPELRKLGDENVRKYTELELRVLCRMMDKLRGALQELGLCLKSWHGAGAIASELLRVNGVRDHLPEVFTSEIPQHQQWQLHAFAGGRIELLKQGCFHGPIYEYDIISAYPSVIERLPSMKGGQWKRRQLDWRVTHETTPEKLKKICDYLSRRNMLSMVRVSARDYSGDQLYPGSTCDAVFFPLFYRDDKARIMFPPIVEGIYMVEEIIASFQWLKKNRLEYEIHLRDMLEFIPGTADLPFHWVRKLFHARQSIKAEIKRTGKPNALQMVIKLGLNALYGKFAQSVGDRVDWACPAYAAAITAAIRARLLRAACENFEKVITFATDAIYTTKRFEEIELGSDLGQWEVECHNGGMFVLSGIYDVGTGGKGKHRTRGYVPNNVAGTLDDLKDKILQSWRSHSREGILYPYSYYMTLGMAIGTGNWQHVGSWVDCDRVLSCHGVGSKRRIACSGDRSLHLVPTAVCFAYYDDRSYEPFDLHKIPLSAMRSPDWLDPEAVFQRDLDREQDDVMAGLE